MKCKKAILIVICPDAREAEKCRQVIEMGHPDWDLRPLVIDPSNAPADDGSSPYMIIFLACLPVLDMTSVEGAVRVLAAIRDTGASVADRKTLTTLILRRASADARKTLEDLMATIEWKDDFIESYVSEGMTKGAIGAKVADIVKVLTARHLQPTEAQLVQVADCADLDQLGRWFDRSLTADTADEVFKD
jgi:hypothetical protein